MTSSQSYTTQTRWLLHTLTAICSAVVCVISISDVKRHPAFLIIFKIIRISDVKRHPTLLGGSWGRRRRVLTDGWGFSQRRLLGRLFQDWTLGLSQLPLLHQGALRGAGRLDISWIGEENIAWIVPKHIQHSRGVLARNICFLSALNCRESNELHNLRKKTFGLYCNVIFIQCTQDQINGL